jgi:PadR family transcriptional regulator PadR
MKIDKGRKKIPHPGSTKQERYIQPSILMGLYLNPSYGYEIIRHIQNFGFVKGDAPPGMIYRHLRQLEEDGLVRSEWKTEGAGPAKRMYSITGEGNEVLSAWIGYMESQAEKLQNFIEMYRRLKKQDP